MKKIREIYELLTDILDSVRSINRTVSISSHCKTDFMSALGDKHLATFYASNPLELKRVLRENSEVGIPPLGLGEMYVVKIFIRS